MFLSKVYSNVLSMIYGNLLKLWCCMAWVVCWTLSIELTDSNHCLLITVVADWILVYFILLISHQQSVTRLYYFVNIRIIIGYHWYWLSHCVASVHSTKCLSGMHTRKKKQQSSSSLGNGLNPWIVLNSDTVATQE